MASEHRFSDVRNDGESREVGRRRFLGYLLAAPTVVAAAEWGSELLGAGAAEAAPSVPQPPELYDLNDLLTDAARPTANLIKVQVNEDGTVSFALPRAETGQGITTSSAMIIAEEMDIPLEMVDVSLADARPELVFNQLTGGSNTTFATFTPIRVAAAIARGQLLRVAALELDDVVTHLTARAGVITSITGDQLSYGELAKRAASVETTEVEANLKPPSEFRLIGTPRNRVDARDIVTGRKKFATDLDVQDAKPTMVCRPPTINGSVESVANADRVANMPGITDVVTISTGVAVRGETFGQCIDAVRALAVEWAGGTVDGESDETILRKVKAAEIPLAVPAAVTDRGAGTVEGEFTFYFASNSALETNSAVADVREDGAEIWSALKSPIVAQQEIAAKLGLPQEAVTVHVTESGGSFGRRLFHDAASEAAEVSQRMGKPVKLMWHRTDDSRHGRTHPMCTSRVRASHIGGEVLSYEQRHTSVATDFSHGFGEIVTAMAGKLPVGGLGLSETIFTVTQSMPYQFGVTTQLLNEVFLPETFHTGSMRNVYSPNVCCARELMVDQLATKLERDPYEFRREFFKDDRARAVLDKVAEVGAWGRRLPPGIAQGIGFHAEYAGVHACLVELDCRPETTEREIRDAVTGPRVTKAVSAVDVGLPINPRGLEAQIMGGVLDGIAITLTSSLHFEDGLPLEGSWDDYFYTRQWNVPPEMEVVIMPPTSDKPGGAGELGVAPAMAAIASAYGRATGTMPTSFPINHGTLSFEPKPKVPPIPQSPTDGLDHIF